MSYRITSENLPLTPKLTDLSNEKLRKIEKFLKDVGEELRDVRMIVDRRPRFGFRAKIEVWIPGTSFVAKEVGFSIEGTIDEAVRDIIRQVNRHKGKLQEKDRNFIRRLKRSLFFMDKWEV
ncbi:ribosome-associated translation inhibitor RaiA [candidate division WWE3 bacterium]|nr:ribosome-associated translation inhibitor RaiA [candidate division WWE3 bacterium]